MHSSHDAFYWAKLICIHFLPIKFAFSCELNILLVANFCTITFCD